MTICTANANSLLGNYFEARSYADTLIEIYVSMSVVFALSWLYYRIMRG